MSIVGSRESDAWEMKVLGPNGFERSYTWAGNAGEHQPLAIENFPESAAGDNDAGRNHRLGGAKDQRMVFEIIVCRTG